MWLLDVGNTRLKLARGGDGPPRAVQALAHAEAGFEAALQAALAGADDGGEAWLSSVAEAATTARVEAQLAAQGLRLRRVATDAERDGLRIAYADPTRLGVDRFLALLAARHRGGDRLLVGAGSVLTVDLLDADGRHHGGWLGIAAPMARDALVARFPALDRGFPRLGGGFASDTPEAVAGGVQAQGFGFVLAALLEAHRLLGRWPGLLLSGGDAGALAETWHATGDGALAPAGAIPCELAEHLVLEGLAHRARAG